MGDRGPLIAVVDDEQAVRTMLRRVLRLAAYDVADFASGEAFLASLDTVLPACAVVDVHMPGLSGFEVEYHLHAGGVQVPMVFITASDDRRLDGASATGAQLLRKPFSTDDLLSAIRAVLDERPVPSGGPDL